MPQVGDSFVATLGQTHLGWGDLRYTNTRNIIYNEAYIPISSDAAHLFHIYNSNYNNGIDVLGVNIFNCTSADGYFTGVLKSSGCRSAGDVYAKNLHGAGDLKALAPWYASWNAQIGDQVKVTWTSSTDIVIRHL